MEKYRLKNILPGHRANLSDGVFIVLFNARTLPPHLLISIDGKIYSITDSGRQMGSSLEKLIQFIKRKNVPSLFVEWKKLEGWKVEKLESLVRNCFLKYDRVVEGKISCLFPIRDIVAEVLGDEFKQANFIFELLPLMEKQNTIGNVFEMNMGTDIANGSFELLTYSEEELRNSILVPKKTI